MPPSFLLNHPSQRSLLERTNPRTLLTLTLDDRTHLWDGENAVYDPRLPEAAKRRTNTAHSLP
jgi:hypothetical protein